MLFSFSLHRCGSFLHKLPRFVQLSAVREFTSVAEFNKVADETLESLHEYFDELLDRCPCIVDNELKDGVLNVSLDHSGSKTYVINKQSVNLQVWLSSPISGPKRFDYYEKEDAWIYRRTKQSLHQLLQLEISDVIPEKVDFSKCEHSGKTGK